MRSYIFTDHERRVIQEFLEGRIHGRGKTIGQIRWRMNKYMALSGDVDLYLQLRGRLAEPEAAAAT